MTNSVYDKDSGEHLTRENGGLLAGSGPHTRTQNMMDGFCFTITPHQPRSKKSCASRDCTHTSLPGARLCFRTDENFAFQCVEIKLLPKAPKSEIRPSHEPQHIQTSLHVQYFTRG